MGIVATTILMLLAASVAQTYAPKFRLPLELVLLLGSIIISFVPGLPSVQLDSEVVFFVFLPPVLFAAAYFTSWHEFVHQLRPIAMMAIGLVIFTVFGIAWVLQTVLPGIPLAVACMLGAILSPPDASAATALVKKLGLPRRLVTIIEGESLVNDATALICYQFALTALFTGSFHLGEAFVAFLIEAVGGMVVGLFVGYSGVALLKRLENSTAESLLSVIICYASYMLGSELHVSGVVSAVVAGLYFGRQVPTVANAQTRIDATAFWNVWLLGINGLVFSLIGLQLPSIIKGLQGYGWPMVIFWAVSVTLSLVVIRFIWVFSSAYLSRLFIPGLKRRDPMPSWQTLTILSWTGMRGIVSLATALALPAALPNGEAFPHRDLLIFITYAVILLTLLVPTITLPTLIKVLGVRGQDDAHKDFSVARVAMAEAVTHRLKSSTVASSSVISQLVSRYENFLFQIRPNLQESGFSALVPADEGTRRALLSALTVERETLLSLRHSGEIHDEVFHELARELDVEELRVRYNSRPL